jgi:hypothetical protein
MNENWQSIAAIAVIIVTVVLFTVRAAKRRKKARLRRQLRLREVRRRMAISMLALDLCTFDPGIAARSPSAFRRHGGGVCRNVLG